MYLVEINTRRASHRQMAMTHTPQKAEQLLNGQVLKNLREAKRPKITQADVGRALGMTGASWQYYEAGQREFTAEKIETALKALGATTHDFEAEKARILGAAPPEASSLAEPPSFIFDLFGRAGTGPEGATTYDVGSSTRRLDLRQILTPSVGAIEMAGDRLRPWAESGEVLLFDRNRAPKREKGCVVEMKDGEASVYLYDRSDGSTLFVRELYPQERTIAVALGGVKGVYPVVLRGD